MTTRKALSVSVAEDLAERIRSGSIQPLGRLPTEADLCVEFDVSRTVVREAIARLRSDGMVVPQQGRGMFVAARPVPRRFFIDFDNLNSASKTCAVLELLLSVEVEAAGLCAERISALDLADLWRRTNLISERRVSPVPADVEIEWHLAIAKGSGNPFLHTFVAYLYSAKTQTRLVHLDQEASGAISPAEVVEEHRRIVEAIDRRDGEAARQNMRAHLTNELNRLITAADK